MDGVGKTGRVPKRPKVELGAVSGRVREIRQKALSEQAEKFAQKDGKKTRVVWRRTAGPVDVPESYAELGFAELEGDLRKAAVGPSHDWAEKYPQQEGARAGSPEYKLGEDNSEGDYFVANHIPANVQTSEELRFLGATRPICPLSCRATSCRTCGWGGQT